MNRLFLMLMLVVSYTNVVANDPISQAFVHFDHLGTYGEAFEEVDVTIKVTLEENHTVTDLRCIVIGEEGAPIIFDQWVNLNGGDNGDVEVSTDSETGELLIEIGTYEMPYVFRATLTPRLSSGEELSPVDAI